jgi:hypothetical protein
MAWVFADRIHETFVGAASESAAIEGCFSDEYFEYFGISPGEGV